MAGVGLAFGLVPSSLVAHVEVRVRGGGRDASDAAGDGWPHRDARPCPIASRPPAAPARIGRRLACFA